MVQTQTSLIEQSKRRLIGVRSETRAEFVNPRENNVNGNVGAVAMHAYGTGTRLISRCPHAISVVTRCCVAIKQKSIILSKVRDSGRWWILSGAERERASRRFSERVVLKNDNTAHCPGEK